MSGTVSDMMKNAKYIADRNPPATYRMGAGHAFNNLDSPEFDCSGFVLTCATVADIPVGGAQATPSMVDGLKNAGWERFAFTGFSNLKKGDVLVWNKEGTSGADANGHTEFVWNPSIPQTIGARGPTGSANGIGFSNPGWQWVFRWPKDGVDPESYSLGIDTVGWSGNYSMSIEQNGSSTGVSASIEIRGWEYQ